MHAGADPGGPGGGGGGGGGGTLLKARLASTLRWDAASLNGRGSYYALAQRQGAWLGVTKSWIRPSPREKVRVGAPGPQTLSQCARAKLN